MRSLRDLLFPYDLDAFLNNDWTQRAIAIAHTEPSLHLTVGIQALLNPDMKGDVRAVRSAALTSPFIFQISNAGIHCKTGIEVLEWMVSELRQQEEWRKSLPLCSTVAVERFDAVVNALMQQLCERWATGAAAQYRHFLGSQTRAIAPYAFPQQAGLALLNPGMNFSLRAARSAALKLKFILQISNAAGFDIFLQGLNTRFQNSLFQRVQIVQQFDATKIIAAGKEVTLRGVPQPVIEQLFLQTQFTGQEVTAWLPEYDWIRR